MARALPAAACGAILLAAALFYGCGERDEGRQRAPKNLLLIVVDTLRADRLGAYGHERATSPTIDALAAEGVLFERAISPAPWTKPAVGSILTGLYPSRHGLVRMGRKLPMAVKTLAELAAEAGFTTGAVVSHTLLGRKFQFDQGFEHFVEVEGASHEHISSPAVTRAAGEVLGRLDEDERPFVLLVHYFDPHYSYMRHADIGFAPERVGRLGGRLAVRKLRAMNPTPEEIAFVRDVYDEEIRFTDDAIGALLDSLRDRGLDESTLVVVTADHGEELSERGWFGHTRGLHEEMVRVPLVIRAPGDVAAGRRVSEPVSLVALLPTLLELLEIPYAIGDYEHGSLAPFMRPDGVPPDEAVYAEVDFVPASGVASDELAPPTLARKKAVLIGTKKLIRDERDGTERLFDLASDPAESKDLARDEPVLAAQLARRLDAFAAGRRGSAFAAPAAELSPREVELLDELGYGAATE